MTTSSAKFAFAAFVASLLSVAAWGSLRADFGHLAATMNIKWAACADRLDRIDEAIHR